MAVDEVNRASCKLTEKCLHLLVWNERSGRGDPAAYFHPLAVTEARRRFILLDESEEDFADLILPILRQIPCLGYGALEKLGHTAFTSSTGI